MNSGVVVNLTQGLKCPSEGSDYQLGSTLIKRFCFPFLTCQTDYLVNTAAAVFNFNCLLAIIFYMRPYISNVLHANRVLILSAGSAKELVSVAWIHFI